MFFPRMAGSISLFWKQEEREGVDDLHQWRSKKREEENNRECCVNVSCHTEDNIHRLPLYHVHGRNISTNN